MSSFKSPLSLASSGDGSSSDRMGLSHHPSGEIHVIVGPMFAGKTTAPLRRVESEGNNGRNVAIIKSSKDTRYAVDSVVTHDGTKFPCWALPDLLSFRQKFGDEAYAKLDVIGIDEAQFFGDLYDFCCKVADHDGKIVIVAGLDRDYLSGSISVLLRGLHHQSSGEAIPENSSPLVTLTKIAENRKPNFCAGESSKQNVPCECAKAPVEPLEGMTALWKPLNCLVETAGITKPGKSIVQESVANSALPIVHEDEENANKITKLKERANKSKVNNDEGRPIPVPSGSEKPKKNRRGRPKRAMAIEGTNIAPQAVVNAASTMCYRKVHPIWLSLIPSDAHDFREGDAPLPQLRSCYLMINAVFGEEMWPAAEYGRTMYTIRQRVGPLLMKMQKRYGKIDEIGELTEKEIIRAERNSGVISNRVREIQMQNYLRKKEMKEQRENDLRQGLQLYKNAKYEEALEKFESVLGRKPDPNEASVASYNVACCYSKLNQIQAGLSALKDALEAGFEDFKRIRTDPDLANIRKSEEFELLMKRFDESFINENAINAIKSLFGIFDKK